MEEGYASYIQDKFEPKTQRFVRDIARDNFEFFNSVIFGRTSDSLRA